jgi:hypothetical protein
LTPVAAELAPKSQKRIVVLHEIDNPEWRWVSHHMPEFDWQFVRAPAATGTIGNRIARLRAALQVAWAGRRADLVISFGAGLGAALELARKLVRLSVPHACYYINFDHLPEGIRRQRQARLYRSINRFVVSATVEKRLYSEHFGIDPARIDVILWGVNPPVASTMTAPHADYVCAVGGNARDYAMLMAVAAARPDMPFVVVARPANLDGLTIPANVETMCNIPYPDAMAVVRGARVMALPLVTTDTPCGHVTIVSAFYLGTPLVITASTGVEDYVDDGTTGLVTAAGSAKAMGAAIDRLWHDRVLADRITATAKAFAETQCTEQNYPPHVRKLLGSGSAANES